ncbi:MAG TPA: ABC transporter substrate-binding protein [Stellaceae bacterium]|jgi:peptide/nickel transport system substrate-binding protein|nr:ABC transporter substrate-binding protein [Stellaceae bacterium]
MKMRITMVAGLCLLFALVAAPALAETTLRIGLAEDPDLLDPTLARTYVGRIVFASMCDKLVDISPELDIVPQLATEWHWTDDNKGLVMKLRQGVKFQDGEPFDAAAVKFNIERHLTLPGSNRKAEISAVTGVEIVDGHTVKLVLSQPFAPLLAALTDRAGMMVSPKAAQSGGDFAAHPVCAGPYKFAERVAQDRIVLDRFPDYWNKDAIKFDRIVFLPIPDTTVRLANLQSGGLDLIERVAATDVAAVEKDKKLKLAQITSLAYQGITINLDNGPRSKNPLGQDPRVRQALELSIDRAALNQVVFNGLFQPGNQWEPPGNPYYVKEMPIPARDVAKAKQLLADAKATHPAITLMVPTNPETLQAAQVIQAMSGEAGFDIKIQATEFASSLDLAVKGDYEAYLIGWSGRTDPDGNIYNFAACKAPPALNTTHYCNPDVDKELDAARTASAPPDRLAHYAKVAEHVLNDRPIIYLWHQKWLYAMTGKLSGFTPYPDGLIRPQGLAMQ